MTDNELRRALLDRFRWVDGHADVWRLLADGPLLAGIAHWMGDQAAARGATKVAGVESRGFLLGGAAAAHAGLGFVAIRKEGGLLPGPKHRRPTEPDYRGRRHVLRIQQAALSPGDRVLVVDDWAEKGSQGSAIRRLVEDCGATYAGLAVLVDQLADPMRDALGPVSALVRADELGPSD